MRLAIVLAMLAMTFAEDHANAQSTPHQVQTQRIDIAVHVAEASLRFGIPEDWIYAVMRVESAGRVTAVSSAGAMGLMQLMPGTWARQRARFGFGSDPFDPRDNIMAGTSYLREMYDRYGAPGFLAAYNAGPGRYEDYAKRGRPLPAETINYVARIVPRLQSGSTAVAASATSSSPMAVRPVVVLWTQASLFAPRSARPESDLGVNADQLAGSPNPVQPRAQNELFAPVSSAFRQ
ncbi:MAG: lytic transglycosylase domain-containing protein [Sphingomonadaceae bacterium]|nr:lytic transglycosylase domain-containing protein [Sphingomonadaceae bacterium]